MTHIVKLSKEAFEKKRIPIPVRIVTKVELTDKGMETWYKGHPFPKKGTPDEMVLVAVDAVKRCALVFARTPVFPKRQVESFAEFSNRTLSKFYLAEKMYCPIAREVLDIPYKSEVERILFKTGAMVLQFDNVYRLSIQDVFALYDSSAPLVKELKRLLDIWISREKNASIILKLKRIRPVINVLYLYPKVRKRLKEILDGLDLEKIKLDEADWYWCLNRPNYDFRGVSYEERKKEFTKITGVKVVSTKELVKKIYG